MLFFSRVTDGASGIYVDVSPRNPTVRVGQNFTFMCRVGKPIMYCSMMLPGISNRLNMNEDTPKTSNYWYAGGGIGNGQCGITIARMEDSLNGQFKCSLGFKDEQSESDGTTNVTVASKNRTCLWVPRVSRLHWHTNLACFQSLTDAAEWDLRLLGILMSSLAHGSECTVVG